MYIVLQIIEVCSDERISEVPRVLSKNLIAYVEAEALLPVYPNAKGP